MSSTTAQEASTKVSYGQHKWAIFYCLVAAIGALCYGYDNTYYNGVLAMQEFKNDYGTETNPTTGQPALDSNFQAVTASAIYIGDLLGALVAAPINDRWGRKAVFWFASFCVLIGGIIQVSDRAYHIAVITMGRIVMGFGVGQFTVTSLLYMGEVSPLAIRGPVLMMFQFLQSLSQLVASGITQGSENISSSLSYKLPMGGLIVLPLVMFATLPFIPESPTWFVLKDRREEAESALRRANRGQADYDPAADLGMLDDMKLVADSCADSSSWASMVSDPVERTKVYYSAGAMFSNQVCGILFFYVYGVVFAQEIGIEDPFLVQLVQNILQIVAVAASIATSHKVRRRTNLFVTSGIMLLAFVVIGALGTQTLTTAMQYILVVFSFFVVVTYNYGLGPLAYTIARETAVGPNQNKIMSTSIVVFYLTTWVISFTAPYLYYDAGLGPMVGFIYAATSCLAIVWIWFCVGETTGRTSLEISLFFANGVPARKWETHQFGGDVGEKPELFDAMDRLKGGRPEHREEAEKV